MRNNSYLVNIYLYSSIMATISLSCVFQDLHAGEQNTKKTTSFFDHQNKLLQQIILSDTSLQNYLAEIPKNKIPLTSQKNLHGKLFADTLRFYIDSILNSYFWKDTNLRILNFPEEIRTIPTYTQTAWNQPKLNVYVKYGKTCKKVAITKGDGFGGVVCTTMDTINDTIFAKGHYFHYDKVLFLESSISDKLTIKGVRISGGGVDEDFGSDPAKTLYEITDSYLDFSGQGASLSAYPAFTDTLEFSCPKRKTDKAIICRGICVSAADGYGIIGKKRAISERCDEYFQDSVQVQTAIRLVNAILKMNLFVVSGGNTKFRIYRTCEACMKDSSESFFP